MIQLATLCYVMNDDHTLMLHRIKKKNDYHEGKWNGLGGKFEPGESPEECAVREVHEESGLIMKKPTLHGIITFPMFDGKKDWYVFLFSAKSFSGKLIDSSEGHLEWIENKNLLDLNLWDGDKIFIPWIFENKCFSAKFIYELGQYKEHTVTFYSGGTDK